MFEGVDTTAALPLADLPVVPATGTSLDGGPYLALPPPDDAVAVLAAAGEDILFLSPNTLDQLTGNDPSTTEQTYYGYTYRYGEGGGGYSGTWGGTSGGGGGDNSNTNDQEGGGYEAMPGCHNTDDIVGIVAPDNAIYKVPEGVTQAYLNGALNHIANIYGGNPLSRGAVTTEIILMYTDPTHKFFVDFKDWGSTSGPAGSIYGGVIGYISDAAGQYVVGSVFEAFGNYFFGMLCTFGGFAPSEIYFAAWYSSESERWDGDDPQDSPHVTNGITGARQFYATNVPVFTVVPTTCG
jgi:hypothetical protein